MDGPFLMQTKEHPIGIHVSIAGELDLSVDRAIDLGCRGTFQIFSCSPRRWNAPKLEPSEVAAFRRKCSETNFEKVFVHMPYLPNLSSPDRKFYEDSIMVLEREIKRCSVLGVPYLILHFGSHMGTSTLAGKERIVAACSKSIEATESLDVRLLLENSADSKSVGSRFDTIGEVLNLVNDRKRMGVCLDTCHAFAAGYDLSTRSAVEKSVDSLESAIGLSNLFVIHLNDSKGKVGSGLDRHDDIGKGNIGDAGMSAILTSEKLAGLPVVLETPRDRAGEDRENIDTTKMLSKGKTRSSASLARNPVRL